MKKNDQGGYVLLAVILLMTLVASLVTSFSRGAVLAKSDGMSSDRMVVQTMLDSGLVFANQSLRHGRTLSRSVDAPSGEQLAVNVSDAGDGLLNIQVTTNASGMSQLLTALAEVHFAEGEELPTLTDTARSAVPTTHNLITVSGSMAFRNQQIAGIFLLRDGATLELENVVLVGAIVSQNAMSDDAWTEPERTKVRIVGSVLIEPSATLAQCAIVAPDATIELVSEPRFQVHGVVVADTINVMDPTAKAVLHRQLAVANSIGFTPNIIQMGVGRGPRPWPTALKSGSQGITRLVFDRQRATSTERSAIQSFDIDAYRAANPRGLATPSRGG
jgi:hypothetical protein